MKRDSVPALSLPSLTLRLHGFSGGTPTGFQAAGGGAGLIKSWGDGVTKSCKKRGAIVPFEYRPYLNAQSKRRPEAPIHSPNHFGTPPSKSTVAEPSGPPHKARTHNPDPARKDPPRRDHCPEGRSRKRIPTLPCKHSADRMRSPDSRCRPPWVGRFLRPEPDSDSTATPRTIPRVGARQD